jgi:hypothetical protein
MILYLQYPGADRQWFKITDFEDLNPVFAMFPMTHEIAMSCDTLKEAVNEIVDYLSGHAMSAWVEDADLSKSLRSKALALGLSLAAMGGDGHKLHAPEVKPTPPQQAGKQETSTDFGKHPMDRFLWNVQQLESSGGSNTNHKPVASGKFKGNKAIGKFGLLKPTIDELNVRMRANGTITPEFQQLEPMSRDMTEEYLSKNPQVELNLARKLAEHITTRQKGNLHRAAFSWLHGHNLHPQDVPDEKLINSEYVSKYKQFDKVNPFAPKRGVSSMKKTMPNIDSSDFKTQVKNWFRRREDEVTTEPMHSSNFQPDPGRKRDDKLDDITPSSMKDPMGRLMENIKRVNDKL